MRLYVEPGYSQEDTVQSIKRGEPGAFVPLVSVPPRALGVSVEVVVEDAVRVRWCTTAGAAESFFHDPEPDRTDCQLPDNQTGGFFSSAVPASTLRVLRRFVVVLLTREQSTTTGHASAKLAGSSTLGRMAPSCPSGHSRATARLD